MFEGQTILITGGTGSWGQELARHLIKSNPREIRIYSRNEHTQVNMLRNFQGNYPIKYMIGDVRDYEAVLEACRGVDYVFHLAALKHVPICEFQPEEALKTNVKGTENVIRASIAQNVKKVVDVSTDKAVNPINFYGMTKAFGEKLMIHANSLSETTKFVCIRGGNVLGTNGSVVPFFKKQILEGKPVTLTSEGMTRFFLTISEAIQLLLKAAEVAIGGETFVMKMNACRIIDLANVMRRRLTSNETNIEVIGIRPGEKLHEVLVSQEEAHNTYQYSSHYFVILPSIPSTVLANRYQTLQKVNFSQYQSDASLMSEEEIEAMLERGGFLT